MLPNITFRDATSEEYQHFEEEGRHYFGPTFGDDAKTMCWPKHAFTPISHPKVVEVNGEAIAIVGEQYIGAGYWTGITKEEKEFLEYHGIRKYHFDRSVRQTGLIVVDRYRSNHQLIARIKAAHIVSLFRRGYWTVFDQTMLEVSSNPAREILRQLNVNPINLPEYRHQLLPPCMRIPRGDIESSKGLVNMTRRDRVLDKYKADRLGYDIKTASKPSDLGSPAITIYWANPFAVPRSTNQMFEVSRTEIKKLVGRFNKTDVTSREIREMQIMLKIHLRGNIS